MYASANGQSNCLLSSTTPDQPAAQHGDQRALAAREDARILISVDFGTTYTSVAWVASSREANLLARDDMWGFASADADSEAIYPAPMLHGDIKAHWNQPGISHAAVGLFLIVRDLLSTQDPAMCTSQGSPPAMASVNCDSQRRLLATSRAARHAGPSDRCPISDCQRHPKGFARKHDCNRHSSPAGHADLRATCIDTPREPSTSSPQLLVAHLISHIACLRAMLTELSRTANGNDEMVHQQLFDLRVSTPGGWLTLNAPV